MVGGGIHMADGTANMDAGGLGVNTNGFGGEFGGGQLSVPSRPIASMHMEWD